MDAINFERIPTSLRELQIWCVHIAKRPFYPVKKWTVADGQLVRRWTLRPASSTNPHTWVSFDTVCHICRVIPDYVDGIGIMLGEGRIAIDLDKCRDPETGLLTTRAQSVVDQFAKLTYTEISRSGFGIHSYLIGRKPTFECRDESWIEIYEHGRFMAMTGNTLPDTPEDLANCQDALDELCDRVFPLEPAPEPQMPATPVDLPDDEVIQKAATFKNGAEFLALWRGDAAGYRKADGTPDHSRADLALCCMLAFVCGPDRDRIDKLFRQSGLMRKKWYRADYRYGTISKAIASCRSFYSPHAASSRHTRHRWSVCPETDVDAGGTGAPRIGTKVTHLSIVSSLISKSVTFVPNSGGSVFCGFEDELSRKKFKRCRSVRVKLIHRETGHDALLSACCNRLNCVDGCGEAIRYHYGHAIHRWEQAYALIVADDRPDIIKKRAAAVRKLRQKYGDGSYVAIRKNGMWWFFSNVRLQDSAHLENAAQTYAEVVGVEGELRIRSSRDLAYRRKAFNEKLYAKDESQLFRYIPIDDLKTILESHGIKVARRWGEDGFHDLDSFKMADTDADTRLAIEDAVLSQLPVSRLCSWVTSAAPIFAGTFNPPLKGRQSACRHEDPATWRFNGDVATCRHCGGFVGGSCEKMLW